MNKSDRKIVKEEVVRVKKELGNDILLTNQYSGDIISAPTPFTFSLFKKIFSYTGSLGRATKELGLPIEPYTVEHFLILFLGRAYLNLREEERFLYQKIGLGYEYTSGNLLLARKSSNPITLLKLFKYSYTQGKIVEGIDTYIKEFNSVVNDWRVTDYRLNTDEYKFDQIIDLLKESCEQFISQYKDIYKLAIIEEIFYTFLKSELKENFSEDLLLTKSNSQNMYKKSVEALDDLALGEITIKSFLERYGIRSFNDFEFSEPRWYEQEDKLVDLFVNRIESTSADYLHRFGIENPILAKLSKKDIKNLERFKELLLLKDNMRFYILQRVWQIRQILLQISQMLNLGENIFFMDLAEILRFENSSVKSVLNESEQRKKEYESNLQISLPNVITSRTTFLPSKVDSAKVSVSGLPVSSGYGQGELFFINNPMQNISPGKIIVLPTSGPEYSHLYNQAKAIIFEKGGILSHGAILSREFRIPAIVCNNIDKIRGWIGEQIIVDAKNGKILLNKIK